MRLGYNCEPKRRSPAFPRAKSPTRPTLRLFLAELSILALTACSPVYQLTTEEDIPSTSKDFFNVFPWGKIHSQKETLTLALDHYGLDWKDVDLSVMCDDNVNTTTDTTQTVQCKATAKDDLGTCSKAPQSSPYFTDTQTVTTTNTPKLGNRKQCVQIVSSGGAQAGAPQGTGGGGLLGAVTAAPAAAAGAMTGGGGPQGAGAGPQGAGGQGVTNVPTAVAAVINASVDECVYWTYQLDTTSLSGTTWATLLGSAVLGTGIYGAVKGWSSVTNGLLSTSGLGITLAGNAQKLAPTPVQAAASSIIQAGLSYYPLIKAQAVSYFGDPRITQRPLPSTQDTEKQNIRMLSALWDAAGSGCQPGVLKGHSWFNISKPNNISTSY